MRAKSAPFLALACLEFLKKKKIVCERWQRVLTQQDAKKEKNASDKKKILPRPPSPHLPPLLP
jgi:hypothetical protein